jgi:hypothetical protein
MRFEKGFALVDQQRSGEVYRATKKPERIQGKTREKQLRANENEGFLFHSS